MGTRWASGQNAIAECDVCGFQYKLRQLRKLVVKGTITEVKACPQCWVPDQPQLHLGEFPVYDPQAIQDPRPDTTYPESRAQIVPLPSYTATGFVGQLSVSVTYSYLLQENGSCILQEDGYRIIVEA
jgi:hypothetical protein